MVESWEDKLPNAARKLHNLLRRVDSASAPLWSGPQLDAAVHRYVAIFLPMLAAHAGLSSVSPLTDVSNRNLERLYEEAEGSKMYSEKLSDEEKKRYLTPFKMLGEAKNVIAVAPIPPLDVAFCWALHRLSPLDYIADCTELFGAPLPTENGLDYIGAHNADEERAVIARLQWACFARAARKIEKRKLFKHRACSRKRKTFLPAHLWPVLDTLGDEVLFKYIQMYQFRPFRASWVSPLRYDLVASAKRQKQFLYNVSGTYYDNDDALRRGARRYRQFLMLMRDNPGKFLVPMYDIDLVWHAHILRDTKAYAMLTKQFVGRFVNHKEDDNRKKGGELDEGFKRTVALWYEAYGEDYEDANTNYKGRIARKRERVYCKSRMMMVKSDDEWRKQFVASVVCDKCKDFTTRFMCGSCRNALIKKVILTRSGQVKGGACAALYNNGFSGSLSQVSNNGGACGSLIGDARGGCGCGSPYGEGTYAGCMGGFGGGSGGCGGACGGCGGCGC